VHCEPARQREKERRQHHWQRDDGKNYVAGQNGKVQCPNRAMAWENRVAVQCVVHDVADEKNGREREGQQHARAMGVLVTMFDEIQPHTERNRARPVQKRVEGRKKHPASGEISGGMMHI